jgi:hypothetical protein
MKAQGYNYMVVGEERTITIVKVYELVPARRRRSLSQPNESEEKLMHESKL